MTPELSEAMTAPAYLARCLSVIALGLCVTNCGDRSVVAPGICTSPITVSVTRGSSPTFSWPAECAINALFVAPGGFINGIPPQPVWNVIGSVGAPFGSVVRYGVTPANAVVLISPVQLEAGKEYDVSIFFAQTGNTYANVASAAFTP